MAGLICGGSVRGLNVPYGTRQHLARCCLHLDPLLTLFNSLLTSLISLT